MGLRGTYNSPGLSFEFDKLQHHYSPGDVISGRVILNTASESAIGKVAVVFWGRAKSRIHQHHGQTAITYRGRVRYFHQEQTLYEGQYTHKPGYFSWPFEFVVPHRADPVCIRSGDKWNAKNNYMSTQGLDLDLTLPATMFHKRYTFGREASCFIEYVLEGTVTEPDGLHMIRKPQQKVVSRSIIFHPLSTPEPIQDYRFNTDRRYITIATLRLLPQHRDTSLGFRDIARSIFQRDTIPRFSFHLTVQAPTVIQLFHPKPIPFRITTTPDLSPENTTIDHSTMGLPEVVLKSAKIELKAFVRCRAPGTFADTTTYTIHILSHRVLNETLPMTHGATTATGATIDLGQICNLRLGNANLGHRLEGPLCPSFTGYNVSRSYQLSWELEVQCAEKTEKVRASSNAPDCAVIMPPATIVLTYPEPEVSQSTELARATSSQTGVSGSSSRSKPGSRLGWWPSRRRAGEPGTDLGEDEGEGEGGRQKGKARFRRSGKIGNAADDMKQNKVLTKEDEAAEDRTHAWQEEEGEQEQFYSATATDIDAEREDEDSCLRDTITGVMDSDDDDDDDDGVSDSDTNRPWTRILPGREAEPEPEPERNPQPHSSRTMPVNGTDMVLDPPPPKYVP